MGGAQFPSGDRLPTPPDGTEKSRGRHRGTMAGMSHTLDPVIAGALKRNEAGLVAAVVQDATTGEVLMQAWMNDEALARTLATDRGIRCVVTDYDELRGLTDPTERLF